MPLHGEWTRAPSSSPRDCCSARLQHPCRSLPVPPLASPQQQQAPLQAQGPRSAARPCNFPRPANPPQWQRRAGWRRPMPAASSSGSSGTTSGSSRRYSASICCAAAGSAGKALLQRPPLPEAATAAHAKLLAAMATGCSWKASRHCMGGGAAGEQRRRWRVPGIRRQQGSTAVHGRRSASFTGPIGREPQNRPARSKPACTQSSAPAPMRRQPRLYSK